MQNVYFFCALVGGTVSVCQFLLAMVGMGGDSDADASGGHDMGDAGGHDAGGNDAGDSGDASGDAAGEGEVGHHAHHGLYGFLSVLSLRTVTAGVAFFGLGGMFADSLGLPPGAGVIVGSMAGFSALYIVFWTMQALGRLRADGTAHIEHAVGLPAVVYLTIPGARAGAGKITVTMRDRTMEYQALTSFTEILPTGSSVTVVGVVGPDMVEVTPAA